MKYCIVIIDGAAGLPLPERGGKTCLELARTPNLDALAREGILGLARTVPPEMEPSSACACMSVLGYDPKVYYHGRSAIEARSMGIPIDDGEVVFRCNLVAIRDGKMWSYSSGYISTEEAKQLIAALNQSLGDDRVHFYPGVSYRHICKLAGREDTLLATCTPPHDIPGKPIDEFMPRGPGSELLRDLMKRSEVVLRDHPVNVERRSGGDIPATTIWLFWGSGKVPDMPAFEQVYGLDAALTSGVDLLRGLARMIGMEVLDIPGVTDGLDNDYAAQAAGALKALEEHDLVVIHIEAPDEAAHAGSIDDKLEAIQRVDREVISQFRWWRGDALRLLVMPDHPTPIKTQTHSPEPVPFLLWGVGFTSNGAKRFTEAEAKSTGLFIGEGYNIMGRLIKEGLMNIFENAAEKIKKYNTDKHRESYNRAYKAILDARCGSDSLVDKVGGVSAKKLEVIDEGLRRFDMAPWMVEREPFISALRDILERDELKKILMKLRDLRITHVNLAEIEKDTKDLYEALCSHESGLAKSGKHFWVGATKVMNFLFPELFVINDSHISNTVHQVYGVYGESFKVYMEIMKICRDELLEWQKMYGNTDSLLKYDGEPTTLVRVFDKCAFIMDAKG